jgi:hypothetical protein
MMGDLLVLLILMFAQSETNVPDGQHEILKATGKGVQIYSCQNAQWVFQAPEATLFNAAGVEIGTHGAGPVWKFKDGRSVKGQVAAKRDAPAAGDIPWLLLKADGGGVEYIRRTETHGGIAPAGACESGKTLRVPYSATYTFYAAGDR